MNSIEERKTKNDVVTRDLVGTQNTDARQWAQAFVETLEIHNLDATDVDWMTTWFANAMMTTYDAAKSSCVKEVEILKTFPIGCYVESTIGAGGPSEVFFDGYAQPFSYLDDYDVTHYHIVEMVPEDG